MNCRNSSLNCAGIDEAGNKKTWHELPGSGYMLYEMQDELKAGYFTSNPKE